MVFLFFKQKTAYEVASGDWSSDVCSSDLTRLQPQPALSLWNREDGAVVGGWRWLASDQLLLFLGPNPVQAPTLQAPAEGDWQLVLQPRQLEALQLLPPGLPLVVKRASQLVLLGRGSGSTALAGRLEFR